MFYVARIHWMCIHRHPCSYIHVSLCVFVCLFGILLLLFRCEHQKSCVTSSATYCLPLFSISKFWCWLVLHFVICLSALESLCMCLRQQSTFPKDALCMRVFVYLRFCFARKIGSKLYFCFRSYCVCWLFVNFIWIINFE